MASSTFVIVIMFALVAGFALAQSPRTAPTVSPTDSPAATPIHRNSTIKSPQRLAIRISHTEGPTATSPSAPPMSPASALNAAVPPSPIAFTPAGAPTSTPPSAARLNRVTVAVAAPLLLGLPLMNCRRFAIPYCSSNKNRDGE